MKLSSREMLLRLGEGARIKDVCREAGINRKEFDAWWKAETVRRVPSLHGPSSVSSAGGAVSIERDEWGIPHVYAESDEDLYFGFGYAMAQDRLFQMDWLRRKGAGRLAEVIGEAGLDNDLAMRTIGINRIAAAEEKMLPAETRTLLRRFSDGVNALIADSAGCLPIEFDLLGYSPEPWSPLSSLLIEGEFRWYLTVRLPVICIPEVAKRALGGDTPLYRAMLEGEADEESILPRGVQYSPLTAPELVGNAIGDPGEGAGSNNWVVAGSRTTSGKPLLASDPHIAFAAVSCWYEVHLSGGSFNVAGMAYSGLPAVMFGRNDSVAWGITNNICSTRDIYQEREKPGSPGHYLFDGKWEKCREVSENIRVKGSTDVRRTVRYTRNGPIIDEVLPGPAKGTGPVSLRWLGATYCRWITSMMGMNRAATIPAFKKAMRGWRVPTFSLVITDVEGNISYQAGGSIPIRSAWERGYRPGWDPAHQWSGLIPQEGLPHTDNPERGWVATANNRPAPDDYPNPLAGTWSSGHRARRIRQMIESKSGVRPGDGKPLGLSDMIAMHQDALSLRAVDCLPGLINSIRDSGNGRVRQALGYLSTWDGRYETDQVAATIFESFFTFWTRTVAAQRFKDSATSEWVAGALGGLATRCLYTNPLNWFSPPSTRLPAIEKAMVTAVTDLTRRFGDDMAQWTWGEAHRIVLRHVLGGRGDLDQLLDRGGLPVKGNGVTVCNTGFDPNYLAPMGANYRLIADMSSDPPGLWAVDAQGQSGHPGSSHYCDQLTEWISGRYHFLSLDSSKARLSTKTVLNLGDASRRVNSSGAGKGRAHAH